MYLLITVKDQETAQNRLLRRCGEMTTLLSVAVIGSPLRTVFPPETRQGRRREIASLPDETS